MITVASFPADLGAWDQDEDPFYLAVFGEAEPLLDMTHAEVIPVGGSAASNTSPTPIYEYWWTIGHGGCKPAHRHLFEDRAKLDLWQRLDDIAARVYLYFPISGGRRTQELAASAKCLSAVAQQSEWTDKAELLDGRLTGSLALSFVPTASVSQALWTPRALPMLAHAAAYADGEATWVPARNKFIDLPLSLYVAP